MVSPNCRDAMPSTALTPRTLVAAAMLATALVASDARAWEFPKLFGGESKNAREATPATGATPDCPDILVENGASMLRAPPGADSANVRHQLTLGAIARECVVEGDRLSIKVGVEGAAVLGPLGQPGAYSGNVRIAVRKQKDDSIVASKIYRASATIPAGATRAEFHIVADPISVPVIGAHAQEDYDILVGFAQGGAESADKPARAGKKRRGQ